MTTPAPMADDHPSGACLCGAVRYRLTGPILGVQYCHCSRCRRFTGSAHAANLFVAPAHLEWLAGEEQIGSWLLEAEPPFPTAFCRTCGSNLPSRSSSGKVWVVPAGTLDEDPGVRPSRSIFWESRAPWYEHVSELPAHAE